MACVSVVNFPDEASRTTAVAVAELIGKEDAVPLEACLGITGSTTVGDGSDDEEEGEDNGTQQEEDEHEVSVQDDVGWEGKGSKVGCRPVLTAG